MLDISEYFSLGGTIVGIILGITPIVSFYSIIKGEADVRIFPEAMIVFNIFTQLLWGVYWKRQSIFIPFLSSSIGLTEATSFCIIYLYYYLNRSIFKWFAGVIAQFAITYGVYYILMYYIPNYERVGNIATCCGIINTIAPAQNIIRVCKEKNYKLIPIASTVAGFTCTLLWFIFGVLIHDYNTYIVNGICTLIQLTTSSIWVYFYCTRKKDGEENDDKVQELKENS